MWYHKLLLFQCGVLTRYFAHFFGMLSLMLHLHELLVGAVHHQKLLVLLLDDGLLLLELNCGLLNHLLLLDRLLLLLLLLHLLPGYRKYSLLIEHAHSVGIVQ